MPPVVLGGQLRNKKAKPVKIYQINFDGTSWNTNERKFPTDLSAIAYARKKEGSRGKLVRISEIRLELHFD
jgi:hypothetical protein